MLKKVDDYVFEVPMDHQKGMRVPGRIFISDKLLAQVEPGTIDQVANVATLPGIVKCSMAMPDAHLGYGFPIGGVAAFREEDGVISPGGVGFDINCGVRLLRSDLRSEDVAPMISNLVEDLFHDVPSGVGAKGRLRVSEHELDEAFTRGAAWRWRLVLGSMRTWNTARRTAGLRAQCRTR